VVDCVRIPDLARSQYQWSNLLSHPKTLSHPGMVWLVHCMAMHCQD
jgi:hypothetical protein